MGLCPDLGALMRQNDALLDDRACMVLMDQPNKDRESYVINKDPKLSGIRFSIC